MILFSLSFLASLTAKEERDSDYVTFIEGCEHSYELNLMTACFGVFTSPS